MAGGMCEVSVGIGQGTELNQIYVFEPDMTNFQRDKPDVTRRN
jgi:hypothetical protein